jgi:hypothetical protein
MRDEQKERKSLPDLLALFSPLQQLGGLPGGQTAGSNTAPTRELSGSFKAKGGRAGNPANSVNLAGWGEDGIRLDLLVVNH